MSFRRRLSILAILCASMALAPACASRQQGPGEPVAASDTGGRFGLFRRGEQRRPAGIGVNSFLWRASLDTLSFMPLSEVDPFGGVIITDWYANPEIPNERFRSTVYILDTRLRADALAVRVFRQERGEDGAWADAPVSAETAVEIENAILTRARQLRIAQIRN
ncbi:MAG: DUF3576 domain-containing protein [Maricaulaceae bacterium]|nr:DUF3576 domain-containing protein [Maricaulaceae bacterium]